MRKLTFSLLDEDGAEVDVVISAIPKVESPSGRRADKPGKTIIKVGSLPALVLDASETNMFYEAVQRAYYEV